MPDYEPAVVIDFPVLQRMIGVGFGERRPDMESWGRMLSEQVSEGLKLRDELGNQPAQSALLTEMASLRSRVEAIQAKGDTGS